MQKLSTVEYLTKYILPGEWQVYLDALDEFPECPEGRWNWELNEEESLAFIEKWEAKAKEWGGKAKLAEFVVGLEFYRQKIIIRNKLGYGKWSDYVKKVLGISRMTSSRRMKTAREVMDKLGIVTAPKKPTMRHIIKAVQLLNADVTAVLHSCLEIAEEEEKHQDKQRVISSFSDLDPEVVRLLTGIDEGILCFDSWKEEAKVRAPEWFNRLNNELFSRQSNVEDNKMKGGKNEG